MSRLFHIWSTDRATIITFY